MANGYQLEGTIHQIDDIQEFKSGFTKREFVVETKDGQYSQMIKFECVKDNTSLTDGCEVGDKVKVHFDIRGNEYNGRFYVNLNAWRLEKADDGGESSRVAESSWDDSDAPPAHLSEAARRAGRVRFRKPVLDSQMGGCQGHGSLEFPLSSSPLRSTWFSARNPGGCVALSANLSKPVGQN